MLDLLLLAMRSRRYCVYQGSKPYLTLDAFSSRRRVRNALTDTRTTGVAITFTQLPFVAPDEQPYYCSQGTKAKSFQLNDFQVIHSVKLSN